MKKFLSFLMAIFMAVPFEAMALMPLTVSADGLASESEDISLYCYFLGKDAPTWVALGNAHQGGIEKTADGDVLVPLTPIVDFANQCLCGYVRTADEKGIYYDNGIVSLSFAYDGSKAEKNGEKLDIRYEFRDLPALGPEIYCSYTALPLLIGVDAEQATTRIYVYDTQSYIDHPVLNVYETENMPKSGAAIAGSDKTAAYILSHTLDVTLDNASGEVALALGGNEIDFGSDKPFIDDAGRVQIPVRYVAEFADCKVDWIDSEKTVVINTDEGKVVKITIGDNNLLADNDIVEMDTNAVIINDRTYVPVRYVAEAMGMTVTWE